MSAFEDESENRRRWDKNEKVASAASTRVAKEGDEVDDDG